MSNSAFLVVGSLNREAPYFQGARGRGISILAFDEERLTVDLVTETAAVDNPTFLTVAPGSGCIYANSEVFGWHEGVVSAFRFDPGRGELVYLNKQPTLGSIAAYNSLTGDGRRLLVANYAMGSGGPDKAVAVFDILPDGGLSPARGSARQEGQGPNTERQERSHAHCVLQTPWDGRVLVTDLGVDRIFSYELDAAGALARTGETKLPPGSGPRHLALHPGGSLVLVASELDSTLHSFRYLSDGGMEALASAPLVPEGASASSHAADLHLSPDGRFAYASNRGHDSIAVLAIDAASGALEPVQTISSGGETPRNFAVTPSGRHLLVANQNSDRITILARDAGTGRLTDTGEHIAVGTPMCVRVAEFGRPA